MTDILTVKGAFFVHITLISIRKGICLLALNIG
jgi:hypothetical protein